MGQNSSFISIHFLEFPIEMELFYIFTESFVIRRNKKKPITIFRNCSNFVLLGVVTLWGELHFGNKKYYT